jgi:hypothetical protein
MIEFPFSQPESEAELEEEALGAEELDIPPDRFGDFCQGLCSIAGGFSGSHLVIHVLKLLGAYGIPAWFLLLGLVVMGGASVTDSDDEEELATRRAITCGVALSTTVTAFNPLWILVSAFAIEVTLVGALLLIIGGIGIALKPRPQAQPENPFYEMEE